jgi:hypothetical protein
VAEASFGTETAGSMSVSPLNAPGDHAACDAETARLRARADAAEAKVAEMRQVAVTFRNRYAGTLGDQASDVICGVLQVADRTPLRAQGRSDGKGAS